MSGAYNSVFLMRKHTGRRTSLIVDPPDGRIPPLTPEATKRGAAVLEYQNALLQATDICRNALVGCSGGTYGPPSPRRLETPPFYVSRGARGGTSGAINRADGPEDRNLSERCLGFGLPDFGSALGCFTG